MKGLNGKNFSSTTWQNKKLFNFSTTQYGNGKHAVHLHVQQRGGLVQSASEDAEEVGVERERVQEEARDIAGLTKILIRYYDTFC